MVITRFSDHAFIGHYGEKEYFVIFDGALVLPKCDYYKRLKDSWDDVNTMLCDERLRRAAKCNLSLDYDECIFMTYSKDGVSKPLDFTARDFELSFVDLIRKYYSGICTDVESVIKVANEIVGEKIGANKLMLPGLSEDLTPIPPMEGSHVEVGKKAHCVLFKESGKYYTEETINIPSAITEEHNFPDYISEYYAGKFCGMHIVCTFEDDGVPFMVPANTRSGSLTLDSAFDRLKNV